MKVIAIGGFRDSPPPVTWREFLDQIVVSVERRFCPL